jgi:hypothetical protein
MRLDADINWLMVMQHHGAPTRLLDWTKSIFVALYFAVTDELEKPGAVWMVQAGTTNRRLSDKYPEYSPEKLKVQDFLKLGGKPSLRFTRSMYCSERMIAQQGYFSVSPMLLASHDDVLLSAFPKPEELIHFGQIIIPSRLKMEFAARLHAMNITADALFPGVDGIGRSITEFVRLYRSGRITAD